MAIGIVLAVAFIAAAGAAPWLYMSKHPLGPGIGGCKLVRDHDARAGCYEEYAFEQLVAGNWAKVGAEFDKAASDARVKNDCHLALHKAGRSYLRKVGERIDFTKFADSFGVCSQGVSHGIVEESVALDAAAFQRIASTWCRQVNSAASLGNCAHGLGHGLILRGVEDAPGRCASLGAVGGDHCLSGMYMERSLHVRNTREALALCSDIPARDAVPCNQYMWHGAAHVSKMDLTVRGALDWCSKHAPEGLSRFGCVSRSPVSVSNDLADVQQCTASPDPRIANICASAIAQERSGRVAVSKVVETCADAGSARFGCAAGYGQRTAWQDTIVPAREVDTSECAVFPDGELRDGCVAGASLCYPALLRFREGGCEGVAIPARYRVRSA